MKLETHDGRVIDPVTVTDIASAITGLTDVGKAFVVLDAADETYAQAAGTVDEGFIVEYRDGGPGEHYRCDRRVTADELITLLVNYLNQVCSWNCAHTWHRIAVHQDAISA